jgi:hypothetical protein
MKQKFYILLLLSILTVVAYAQQQENNLFNKLSNAATKIDTKLITKLNNQYKKTDDRLTKQSTKWLSKLQKEETKLKLKLAKTDSAKAEQVFGDINSRYNKMKADLNKQDAKVKQYIPSLDSLATTAKFLQQNANLSLGGDSKKILQFSKTIGDVQQKMQQATNLKKQVQQHKEQLKQQLQNTPIAKQLQKLNKQAYYYNQQVNEYKELFDNPDKLTEKAIGLVKDNAAFKEFFSNHSILGQLFKVPQNTSGGVASLNGLQTRASVMQSLQQRLGITDIMAGNNSNPQSILKNKINAAKGELDKLKNKLNSGGNVNDADMPNFKPNTQRTKSFLKRLEYGFNIQSQKNNAVLPTTSDVAATVGYKLNDKATLGLGIAYKLGWGNGWENIRLTNQGVGIRSFVDIKFPTSKTERTVWNFLTKNLWLSGGYELNYLPEIKDKLTNTNTLLRKTNWLGLAWQDAALIGISKKQKVGKKTVSMQFLYNINHKQTYPQQQQIVFRVGWSK